jgi:hypothetical protein
MMKPLEDLADEGTKDKNEAEVASWEVRLAAGDLLRDLEDKCKGPMNDKPDLLVCVTACMQGVDTLNKKVEEARTRFAAKGATIESLPK